MPATPNELKWDSPRIIEEDKQLSAEELETLKNKQQALDKVLADEGKAKYKIEVLFTHARRTTGPIAGALSIWESGAKFHGGGDTKAYWCPGKELKRNDCTGIIPDASNGYGHLVCPKCQVVWTGEDVIGELLYKLDAWKWADVLLKHYVALGHNADIYTKYPKADLRIASHLEQAKQLMGEQLSKVRTQRVQVIYPLKNIITDVSAGADLRTRFHAFLTA